MSRCKACEVPLEAAAELCGDCGAKQLVCRVCGREFGYREIAEKLPIVQCPSCEGRAIEVLE